MSCDELEGEGLQLRGGSRGGAPGGSTRGVSSKRSSSGVSRNQGKDLSGPYQGAKTPILKLCKMSVDILFLGWGCQVVLPLVFHLVHWRRTAPLLFCLAGKDCFKMSGSRGVRSLSRSITSWIHTSKRARQWQFQEHA